MQILCGGFFRPRYFFVLLNKATQYKLVAMNNKSRLMRTDVYSDASEKNAYTRFTCAASASEVFA